MILNWLQPKFAAQPVRNEMPPVPGKDNCSDWIRTAQRLQMRVRKMSGMILINCDQSLQPNWSQMKCDVWKPWNDQQWQDEIQFLIWRLFEQFVFVNNHLIWYWPTIHNSILKMYPKYQVISSHFIEVNELLNEQWAKIVLSDSWKYFNSSLCRIVIKCIDQRFAFKNFGIWCLTLIFTLSNLRTTILHAKKRLQVVKHFKKNSCFFFRLILTHALAVKESRVSEAAWDQFLHWAETISCPSAILHGTEPVSALTCAFFTWHSLWYFHTWNLSVAISLWKGLTLNMNIRLPLFWSTWR